MAARAGTSQLPFLLLLLLLLLLDSAMWLASADGGRRGVLAYVPARKRPAGGKATVGADCRAMVSRAECLGRSERCRWCRSDAVDDLCFGSAEAWRLPRQIFSCEAPGA